MLNLWGVIPLTFDDAKVLIKIESTKEFLMFNIYLTQSIGKC
jgi:hypothetical protein